MLGVADYHKLVPRQPGANVLYRQKLLSACRSDPSYRRAVLEMCRRDILFFVNVFVWQYNPNSILWTGTDRKRGPAVGPFCTWPFQDKAILVILDHIERGEDLLIVKSREMGASWICIIVMLWYWLFVPMAKFLLVSRSADAVEAEDPDSLLWKWDFIIKYLPGWGAPSVKKRSMYRENEGNGSATTGQASTGKAGVGGRATAIFVDEFSLIKEDWEVYSHTSDTGGCRIFNGTHRGTGTCFADLANRSSIKKQLMHWSEHQEKKKGLYRADPENPGVPKILDNNFSFPPDYSFVLDGAPSGGPHPGLRSPWYDYQCGRKGSPREVAMDLDINPEGSVDQFFDPILLRQLEAEDGRDPFWQGDLVYDEELGRPLSLEPRVKGPLKLWCKTDGQGRPRKAPYFIGSDVSGGRGATPTCFSILDGQTGEKVGQYTNAHIRPTEAGTLLVALAWMFQDEAGRGARLIWELQGPGATLSERVVELGYVNFYLRTDEMRIDRPISPTPGWNASPINMDRMLNEYREALRTRRFVNHSVEALRECLQFKWNGGHVVHSQYDCEDQSGAKAAHGDHVIADGLAWKLAKLTGCEGRAPKAKEDIVPVLSLAWRRQRTDNQARRETRLEAGYR